MPPIQVKTGSTSGRVKVTAQLRGPFFEGDPSKTFDENARRVFEVIAAGGEADVKAILMPVSKTGTTARLVWGRTTRLDGAPFKSPGAVVTQTRVFPWKGHTLQGGDAAAEVVGAYRAGAIYMGGRWAAQVAAFKTVRGRVGRAKRMLQAELLKGIA